MARAEQFLATVEQADQAELAKFNEQERRHRLAAIGAYLDNFLASPIFNFEPEPTDYGHGSKYESQLHHLQQLFFRYCKNTYGIDDISDKDMELFNEYIDGYKTFRQMAHLHKKKLQMAFFEDREDKDISAEDWGHAFFKARVDSVPDGIVRAYIREGYFIIFCAEKSDYKKIIRGRQTNGSVIENSGGTFHRSIKLGVQVAGNSVEPNIILVNGIDESQDKVARVVTHEKQHYANTHMYAGRWGGKFFYLEFDKRGGNKDTFWPEYFKYANIKDEVLAYIRDGRGGAIDRILHGKLYANLFTQFSVAEKINTEELLEKIADGIRALEKTVLVTDGGRKVLVHRLIRELLEDYPTELSNILKYYKDKQAMIADFFPEELSDDILFSKTKRHIFLRNAQRKGKAYYDYARACVHAYINVITDPRRTGLIIDGLKIKQAEAAKAN